MTSTGHCLFGQHGIAIISQAFSLSPCLIQQLSPNLISCTVSKIIFDKAYHKYIGASHVHGNCDLLRTVVDLLAFFYYQQQW